MAQPRGELVLLELEEKMLKAVKLAWDEYDHGGKVGLIPTKLVTLILEVHKAVMQRMNAKYGIDGSVSDMLAVRAALAKEIEMMDRMIAQQNMGIQ